MTTLRPVRVLFSITTVLTLGACTVSDDSFEPRDGNDAEDVTLCHYPPDNPEAHHTIVVGAGAVAEHLEKHGDSLGPCPTPCELKCDDLAAAVGAFCEGGPLPPELPEDFCQTAQELVEASCDEQCPEPPPEQCNDFCSDLAHQVHFECFELQPDPFICDVGADVTYNECLATFECPPPPPSCWDDCQASFDAAIMQCEAAGLDPMCVDQAHLELFACEEGCCAAECIESCPMQCGDDPLCLEACEVQCGDMCHQPPPPPPNPCLDECFFAFDQALQACDQAGGDPACYMEAENQFFACEATCCAADCSATCPDQCLDDPLCLAECQDQCSLMCEPPPPPEPTCDQICVDQANAGYTDCVAMGPDPAAPCAGVSPEQSCLVTWQGFINDCIFNETCIDPNASCENGCSLLYGQTFLACVDEPLCQDPVVCEPEAFMAFDQCMVGCQPPLCPPDLVECPGGFCVLPDEPCPPPPEPTCEDLCHEEAFADHEACFLSGEDPGICDQQFMEQLDACLMSCPAPELCPPDLVECPGGFCVLPGEPCPPPPEPTCEDLCHEQAMADHAACFESGEDPVLCEEQFVEQLDACLMSCQAPEPCPPGELECPDGVCVPEGEPCPGSCPPDMVECGPGMCVLPGEPCP